ncbi:MAG: hypothetical protein IK118_05110, partial [Clostridia bacterium]|nr:hypothetical protein [Clostridia bacterium]
AELVPDLEPGTYDVIIEFAGDDSYRSAASRNTLTINERINRSGIYVRANEMRNVDLDAFKECKIGHIFLQSDALSLYGEDVVENFISDALERGIKTHMWVLGLFSNGKWVNPINAATGEYNTDYFNEKAEEIHKIAALEGLYGIHFDCTRFEGGEKSRADRYTSGGEPAGEKAVNEFVNTMCKEARLENSALIFSGTLMPDPQESIARYGQDVAALSQYFSFFVPMTYVGIYLDDVSEITAICTAFDEISGDAEIWAGVIGYDSDDSQVAISEETLRSYAEAAYAGNAMGVTLFRYGKADLGVNRGKDPCPLIDLEP